MDGDLPRAGAGEAVTLTLADEIDASRGDVLADDAARPVLAEQFAAHIVWMSESQMLPGRSYLLAIGASLGGGIEQIRARPDFPDQVERLLKLAESARCAQ